MKKWSIKSVGLLLTMLGLMIIVFATSCSEMAQERVKVVKVQKIVKDKKESMETESHHKFNVWKGDFELQPDIHTVYYLVYADGSYDRVDMGKYAITDIGDTITVEEYQR